MKRKRIYIAYTGGMNFVMKSHMATNKILMSTTQL